MEVRREENGKLWTMENNHQSEMAGGIFMENYMPEMYFKIKITLVVVWAVLSVIGVIWKIWRWFNY